MGAPHGATRRPDRRRVPLGAGRRRWSLRRDDDGLWRLGGGEVDGPVPVTTIARRRGHVGAQCLGGFARLRFGVDGPADAEVAASATELGGVLERQYRAWRVRLAQLGTDEWAAPRGPAWGPHAEDTHHGAEVGVLRDLYARRGAATTPG
ncbi:MAG: hypothetical protein ACHQFZ_01080 [Acidimicrobiales bacterium]